MNTKNRIGILGVGAIGSVVSYELSKVENNKLLYYSRSPKSLIKIKFEKAEWILSIDCQIEIKEPVELDWLVICLKEYQYKNATAAFRNLITEKTKVAIIRNGINLKESILDYCSEENILECMIDCPVQPKEDGFYRQFRLPTITLVDNDLASSFSEILALSDLSKISTRKTFSSII